jgi:peptide/nickel transport system substrate-binding protein
MKKKTLSLILALIMALSLVACGGGNSSDNGGKADKPDAGNSSDLGSSVEVTGNNDADAKYAEEITMCTTIKSLDPNDSWATEREAYHLLVFDTLVYNNDITGEITMQLAKSVEWDNKECTRIHVILRDDVVFSNGDPVTAADVEFSLGRANYSSLAGYYDNCEIVSDTELYINLSSPCSAFISVLGRACAAIVCKAEAEKNPDGLALIGSGPFMYDMSTYVAANTVTVVRNEKFWGEKTPTQKIKVVMISDAAAKGVALQSGDIHWATGLNFTELPVLKQNKNLEINEIQGYSFVYMAMNDRRDTTSITEEEKNFRRAVACAINKEDIVAGFGGGMPMTSMWPYDDPACIQNESDYEHDLSYNPDMAKEYLANAGGKTEFKVLANTADANVKLAAQVIQEQLRLVGITMVIEETDATGFSSATQWDRDITQYDAYMQSNIFAIDPVNWNYYTENQSINKAVMVNPEISKALKAVKATSNPEERTELLQIMQREVHENVSYLPLAYFPKAFGYAKGLENFRISSIPSYYMRNMTLRVDK